MRAAYLAVAVPLAAAVLALITAPPVNPLMPVTGCAIGPGQATAEGFLWLAFGGLLWLLLRRHPQAPRRRPGQPPRG